jgi:predicted DNA-binding protein (MmcQ/YjbR family)
MNYKEFNKFCRSLPATTYVIQWGGSHVWKVGGKVFAIGGWQEDAPSFTFKVSDIAYEMLKEQPGLRPAPYLASRGMKWIQHFAKPGLSDAGLRDYVRQSHAIVSQGLSKKKRIAFGLAPKRNESSLSALRRRLTGTEFVSRPAIRGLYGETNDTL